MAKRRELQAGRYHVVTTYSSIKRKDAPKARAEKRNHATKAQQIVNDRNSRIALTGIIAANFMDSSTAYFTTLTFDDDHYPNLKKPSAYRYFCRKETGLYIKRLRRLAGKRGTELRYVFCIGTGACGRWHVHMVIDGVTATDLRDTWGRGNVDYHNLHGEKEWVAARNWNSISSNTNPVAIAKYMMGNTGSRPVGSHFWHASKNCARGIIKPVTTVADNASIEPPAGAEILDRETTSLVYSTFRFIEYIDPLPKSKRGKRKCSELVSL